MTGDFTRRDRRVGVEYRAEHGLQDLVLPVVVRRFVLALEFDAYRKIITAVLAAKKRLACMPGALAEGYELYHRAIAAYQQVGRHLEPPDLLEVRVRIEIQRIRKQRLDLRTAELARRQADAVEHDELRVSTARPPIPVRAETLLGGLDKPGIGIDPEALLHGLLAPGCTTF